MHRQFNTSFEREGYFRGRHGVFVTASWPPRPASKTLLYLPQEQKVRKHLGGTQQAMAVEEVLVEPCVQADSSFRRAI